MSWRSITAGRCLHRRPRQPACSGWLSWGARPAVRAITWAKAAAASSQAAQPDASELDLLAMQLSDNVARVNAPSVPPSVEPDVGSASSSIGFSSTTISTTSSSGSSSSQRPVPKAVDKVYLTKQEAREVSRRLRDAAPQPGRRVLKVYRWAKKRLAPVVGWEGLGCSSAESTNRSIAYACTQAADDGKVPCSTAVRLMVLCVWANTVATSLQPLQVRHG
jgi:hypothetical protein